MSRSALFAWKFQGVNMIKDFTTPSQIDLYGAMFRDLMSNRSSRIVQNDSALHAKAIISELLKAARSSLCIFCDRLSADIWDDPSVLDAMVVAIRAGSHVSVITKNVPCSSQMLSLLNSSRASVRIMCEPVSLPNFIVVDSSSYRLEIDEIRRKGIACAHDVEQSRLLVQAFEKLQRMSKDVKTGCTDLCSPDSLSGGTGVSEDAS